MPACAGMTVAGLRGKSVSPLGFAAPLPVVIPAKAGIQRLQSHASMEPWMPAFAGMTTAESAGTAAGCLCTSRVAAAYSPATIILPTRIEPVRTCERRSTSLPIASKLSNMRRRLPAMVMPSTGYWISPFSTQNPAAPRE